MVWPADFEKAVSDGASDFTDHTGYATLSTVAAKSTLTFIYPQVNPADPLLAREETLVPIPEGGA